MIPPPPERGVSTEHYTPAFWGIMAACAGVALVVLWIPLANWIFSYLAIVIHEFGHTVPAWLFGHPTIPKFNLVHGGGLAMGTAEPQPLLLFFVAGAAAIGGWLLWQNVPKFREPPALIAAGALVLGWLFLFFSGWYMQVVDYGGHGLELVFAGIFFWYAITGRLDGNQWDRWTAAVVGFWLVFHNLGFAWGLMTDDHFINQYRGGIGGLMDHDFVKLETHTMFSLGGVAFLHLLATLAVIPLTFGGVWYIRERAQAGTEATVD